MKVNTLRPGLLVSLNTRLIGNVAYQRSDVEPEHLTPEGTKFAKWETERTVTDPDEFEEAKNIRGKCRFLVAKICSATTFGLLCPEDKRQELDEAVREASDLATDFNLTSALTKVHVYVIVGRIAADDVEAVRAINSEVRSLLDQITGGLRNLDVKAVREAANKAKSIGQMLSPEAADRIKVAVEAAREAARKIVKAGEETAFAIDRATIRKITQSRTMFLDLYEEHNEVQVPVAVARAVELDPDVAAASADYIAEQKRQRRQIEME